jgi:hypothetical protein
LPGWRHLEGTVSRYDIPIRVMKDVYPLGVGLFWQPGIMSKDLDDQRHGFRVESDQYMHGAVLLAQEASR